jgi:hypothetical protein
MNIKPDTAAKIVAVLANEYRWPFCRRCPGGLSLTDIVERTGADLREAHVVLDNLVKSNHLMRLRIDGSLRSLFYMRPKDWKDAPPSVKD